MPICGLGISYQCDPLNRITGKSYFNITGTISFQRAAYTYDDPTIQYSKGQLTAVSTLASTWTPDTSTVNYLSFDALGRVTSSSQTTAGNTYTFPSYSYNLAGSLTSLIYPSGRLLNTCYDGANRVSQVGGTTCSSSGNYVPTAYASGFAYAAHGAPTQYTLGNNIAQTATYNSRLQTYTFTTANNTTQSQLLAATLTWGTGNNSYPADPGSDNGNLIGAVFVNGGPGYTTPLTFFQSFTYDGVNRLVTASDSGGWSRTFGYDAYGNMTPSGRPNPPAISFNSNNQIIGLNYDQAGNQQTVNGNTIAYDWENRIVTETDSVSQGVETYIYDGNGNRIEKYGPGGTPATVYVYDAMNQLAAEYSTTANTLPCTTCYLSSDYLGTPRVITDQNGLVISRHDYLPFGEEVQASTFGRDNNWGPGNDTVSQKFTGKERDAESGLDYFGARYYGSALGRFTSPDWSDRPQPVPYADLRNPQTLNLYVYVHNNPLASADPDGHADCGGEKDHSWLYCLANALNLNETQTQKVDAARTFFEINPTKDGQGNVINPANLSDSEVLQAFHDVNQKVVDQMTLEAIASAPERFVDLTDMKARTHILDGEANGSGGHCPGTGTPGKSEFPAGWSDAKILHEISDVATDPNSRTYKQGSVTVVEGRREGVDIRVIERDNRIVTGYPTNLPRNP